jgi:hypothetical protein
MRHTTSGFEYKMIAARISSQTTRVVAVGAGRSIAWPFLERSVDCSCRNRALSWRSKNVPIGLHASRRRVTAQVANERVDLAALSFPFNCEQSHLRTAVGAGNREIFNIRSRVVLLAHASDSPSASHARAIARPGIGFQRRKGHNGTFRGNVGRLFRGSQVAGFGLRPLPVC